MVSGRGRGRGNAVMSEWWSRCGCLQGLLKRWLVQCVQGPLYEATPLSRPRPAPPSAPPPGFMLNVCVVLLELSRPFFAAHPAADKLALIAPGYAAAPTCRLDLAGETCLAQGTLGEWAWHSQRGLTPPPPPPPRAGAAAGRQPPALCPAHHTLQVCDGVLLCHPASAARGSAPRHERVWPDSVRPRQTDRGPHRQPGEAAQELARSEGAWFQRRGVWSRGLGMA